MNYGVYPDLNANRNQNFSQVVNSSGRIVQGDFLNHFSTTNYASWSYYDTRLRTLLSQSAFVARYHTAQFRQFDAAIQTLYLENTVSENVETFSTTTDWQEMLSNTMYMIANINTRMNLLNDGLSAIFESSNALSESTFTLNYLSATYWPRGTTWTEQWVPAELTDAPLDFAAATYMGDSLENDHARLTLSADFSDDSQVRTAILSPDLFDSSFSGNTVIAIEAINVNNGGGAQYLQTLQIVNNNDASLAVSQIYLNNINIYTSTGLGSITNLAIYSVSSDFSVVVQTNMSVAYPTNVVLNFLNFDT